MHEENNVKKNSFIKRYGVNFTEQEYVVNPAIGRDKEIKELSLVLLTPDKSAILTGKPGIGKTAIVEGLAYLIQKNEVPNALKGYTIIKVDTQSLMGVDAETGDSRVQVLIDEILSNEKYILFIDEIHTLVNATSESALDFAQMFKTGLGRGDIKVIGATTSAEYEKYILRDKAFTRRFQKIEVAEPDVEMTVKIVTGVIPRIEKNTGIKMGYTPFIQEKLARFVTEVTTEYNRVYETGARYPDVAITMFSNAFSEALFDNKDIVSAFHVRKAIEHSKAVYPDVIKKYLPLFDNEFKTFLEDDESYRKSDISTQKYESISNDIIHEKENTNLSNVESTNSNSLEQNISNFNSIDNIYSSLPNSDLINNDTKTDTIANSSIDNHINEINEEPFNNQTNSNSNNITSINDLNKIYDRISNPFDELRKN